MSQIQNTLSDWPVALVIAFFLLLITIFVFSVVNVRREIVRLQEDLKQLSADVKGLLVAEQRRFLVELKGTRKEGNERSTAA
jgi:hypothetical protein